MRGGLLSPPGVPARSVSRVHFRGGGYGNREARLHDEWREHHGGGVRTPHRRLPPRRKLSHRDPAAIRLQELSWHHAFESTYCGNARRTGRLKSIRRISEDLSSVQ